jgi:glycosyltransferase involved in cell wall biosynthesis
MHTSLRPAVVIPAFNEESSIALVVGAIPEGYVKEVIVVNNGSTDRTAEVAREAGATVVTELQRGYGAACLRGIDRAVALGADTIVFLDGDFSDYPEEIPTLVREIERGFHLVIGSRMMGERAKGALLPQAIIGNWIATFLIRLFWGCRFTDLGPFRAVRIDSLQRMKMSDPTYGWTVEMQVKAAKLGLRCTEVPVKYRKRIGISKVTGTLKGSLMASSKILYVIFKHLLVRV